MNRFYTLSKVPLLIALVLLSQTSGAQNITTVTNPGDCGVIVADFNSGDNGFNASPYTGDPNSANQFYYNSSRGYWTELGPAGQEKTIPPVSFFGIPRIPGLISPPVLNPNQAGTFTIGFDYIVPNPAADFFQITIFSISPAPNNTTVFNKVAATDPLPFVLYSSPVPYTDPNPLQTGFSGTVCIRLNDADITNAQYTTYRVEIKYFIGEPVYSAIDNISFGPNELIILPVNFIGLSAYKQNSDVLLRWDVAEEQDVLRYEVERSANGRDYTKIGEVSVNPKSRLYDFTDKNPLPGGSFYRVRNVDIDGKFLYSPVARMNLSKFVPLRAFPTPATSGVNIEHEILSTRGKLTVYSADGRAVKTVVTQQGTSQTPLNLSNLGSGFYVVRFDKGNGEVETVKLLKK
jgi:hypothetical protein